MEAAAEHDVIATAQQWLDAQSPMLAKDIARHTVDHHITSTVETRFKSDHLLDTIKEPLV